MVDDVHSKEQHEDNFVQRAQKMVSDLDLSSRFLSDLLAEDDWSFIIKSHALIETALTHMLAREYGGKHEASGVDRTEQLEDLFSSLPLLGRSGKLDFAVRHSHLDKRDARFIKSLSEVRNRYVHNIKNIHIPLSHMVNPRQQSLRRKYLKDLSLFYGHTSVDSQIDEMFYQNPKRVIFTATLAVLAQMFNILHPPFASVGQLSDLFSNHAEKSP